MCYGTEQGQKAVGRSSRNGTQPAAARGLCRTLCPLRGHVPNTPLILHVPAATTIQTGPSPGSPAGGAHPDPCQHHAGALALHQAQQAAGQSREGVHQLQPLLPPGESMAVLHVPLGCPCPVVAVWVPAGRRASFHPSKPRKAFLLVWSGRCPPPPCALLCIHQLGMHKAGLGKTLLLPNPFCGGWKEPLTLAAHALLYPSRSSTVSVCASLRSP